MTGPSKATIRIDPAARPVLEKARRLAARREYAEAAVEFENARRKGAAYHALAGEALCFYKMGRVAEALSLAAEAARARPDSGEPPFIAGLALKDAGRYDEAVEALDRAEALGYSRGMVRYHRAAAHFLANRMAEAEADFEEAAALLPSSAAVFYNLAVTRVRRSRWKEAAEGFSKCAQLDPAARRHYHELVFEAGRAAASEEFHFRGHRIKNMLALLADMSRRSVDALGEKSPAAQEIAAVAERLNKVFAEMSDLLSWARREPLELDVWDIHDVIESALMSAGGALSKVKVEKDFSPGVPGIICDAHALSEAFLNVMINAAEAMPGGGALYIRTGRGPGERVSVELEDTGGGITVEPREKIFQFAFSTKPNGNGLGLCQAARTVDEHGGSIKVEDGVRGARFTIALPLAARIGETVQDMGLKADLSEDISGLSTGTEAAENGRSQPGS